MAGIEARGLRKVFGTTVALDGVDLRVEEGRTLAPRERRGRRALVGAAGTIGKLDRSGARRHPEGAY